MRRSLKPDLIFYANGIHLKLIKFGTSAYFTPSLISAKTA